MDRVFRITWPRKPSRRTLREVLMTLLEFSENPRLAMDLDSPGSSSSEISSYVCPRCSKASVTECRLKTHLEWSSQDCIKEQARLARSDPSVFENLPTVGATITSLRLFERLSLLRTYSHDCTLSCRHVAYRITDRCCYRKLSTIVDQPFAILFVFYVSSKMRTKGLKRIYFVLYHEEHPR